MRRKRGVARNSPRKSARKSARKKRFFGDLRGLFGEILLFPLRLYASFPSRVSRAAVLVLFLAASWMIVVWIMDEAVTLPVYTVDPGRVRLTARPAWLDMSSCAGMDVMANLRGTLARFRSRSIFSDAFVNRIREDLGRSSPWVEEVVSIERVFPSQLKARLRLRRPTALFFRRSKGFYVDSEGVLVAAFSAAGGGPGGAMGLPVIVGADPLSSLRPGYRFRNAALREGAAVGAEVTALAGRLGGRMVPVDRIDVSRYGRGRAGDVVLVTRGGVRILWGRSSRHEEFRGIDPSLEEKAENLAAVLEERPGLEGVAEVTLTFEKPSYRLRAGRDAGGARNK